MYKQLGRRFWGYTYEEMEKDLEIFARAFPETMELRTLEKLQIKGKFTSLSWDGQTPEKGYFCLAPFTEENT